MEIKSDKVYHACVVGWPSVADPYWVTQLPGEGGVDWGFGRREKARPLSAFWARRFRQDSAACGRKVHFVAAS